MDKCVQRIGTDAGCDEAGLNRPWVLCRDDCHCSARSAHRGHGVVGPREHDGSKSGQASVVVSVRRCCTCNIVRGKPMSQFVFELDTEACFDNIEVDLDVGLLREGMKALEDLRERVDQGHIQIESDSPRGHPDSLADPDKVRTLRICDVRLHTGRRTESARDNEPSQSVGRTHQENLKTDRKDPRWSWDSVALRVIEPVSYTHLDVYKRQVNFLPEEAADGFSLFGTPSEIAGQLREAIAVLGKVDVVVPHPVPTPPPSSTYQRWFIEEVWPLV